MSETAIVPRARFAPNGDALAARLKLDRELSAADWSVPGFPPSAILCARRLRARAHEPGAIRSALQALARSAARPAREFVPAAAEAVWFADSSEWLACLARDALAGELALRWWWDGVRRGASGVRAAAREWTAAPADAPAAWRILGDWDRATAFAAALEPAEAAALTRTVCAAFGLCAPDPPRAASGARGTAAAPPSIVGAEERPLTPREAAALPPGPRRAALALGLLLARAPHRDPHVAARVLAWAEFGPEPLNSDTGDSGSRPERQEPALQRASAESRAPRSAPGLSADASGPAQRPNPEPDERLTSDRESAPLADAGTTNATARPDVRGSSRPPAGEAGPGRPRAPADPSDDVLSSATVTGAEPGVVPSTPLQSVVRTVERSPVPERIETEFGGLLYLVNVALSLELYPDFTEPTRPGIALALWDWLALLGRRWIGPPFLDDPLDALLAALAGRDPAIPPGAGVDPPNEWRLPEPWSAWARGPEERGWPTLAEWLDWLAPVIAARLSAALDTADPIEAPRWLIGRRAAVLIAPAHLDVMLPLADLAVEIRIALLDRDPGWIPATGTTVRFHYESHG